MNSKISSIKKSCFRSIRIVVSLLASSFAGTSWDGGQGADAACKAKIDESGAFQYADVEINGNVGYCYVKAKDGEGEKSHATSILMDDPSEEKPAEEKSKSKSDSNANSSPPPQPSSSSSDASDKFGERCIKEYFATDFENEINAAYKTMQSGTGGSTGGVSNNGNVAVLEWNDKGTLKRQWFTSGNGHSEEHILKYLKDKSIPRESVTRIFSELSPCLNKCLPKLSEHFKGIRKKVTLEFHWIHDTETAYKTCDFKDAKVIRNEKKTERRNKVLAK